MLQEIKTNTKLNQLSDNVYADCRAVQKEKIAKKVKTVSRRTQTYLRELLSVNAEDMQESDLEVILEDDAELDHDYAKDLIDNVLEGMSETDSVQTGRTSKRRKKKKGAGGKRMKDVPDFELQEIIGEFELDDLGNFIIQRGEAGELLDKLERRVNRRGYLIDRFGNVINKNGQIIFKQVELNSDDEIPAPFGFEKRKKNLLQMGDEGEFKVNQNQKVVDDDEDVVEKEMKSIKKKGKGRGKAKEDEDTSSVDSLMADAPGQYQLDSNTQNEDEIIDRVTKMKVPKKRGEGSPNRRVSSKGRSQNRSQNASPPHAPQHVSTKRPLVNKPPKRWKGEEAKELFPSLSVASQEQKKLFKIAESISTFAQDVKKEKGKSTEKVPVVSS